MNQKSLRSDIFSSLRVSFVISSADFTPIQSENSSCDPYWQHRSDYVSGPTGINSAMPSWNKQFAVPVMLILYKADTNDTSQISACV